MKNIVSIISGDIIQSSTLPPEVREELFMKLSSLLKVFKKKDKSFIGETNKGDWFQCLIPNPAESLRYALQIKTYLRSLQIPYNEKQYSFDARISIGIGEVEFLGNRLGNSDGPAFRLSGRLLDSIKNSPRTLVVQTEADEVNGELETMFHLLDFIFSKTTSLQCEVIYRKLESAKEMDIAKELHILQSAVNQRASAAGWKSIEDALNRFETIIKAANG